MIWVRKTDDEAAGEIVTRELFRLRASFFARGASTAESVVDSLALAQASFPNEVRSDRFRHPERRLWRHSAEFVAMCRGTPRLPVHHPVFMIDAAH